MWLLRSISIDIYFKSTLVLGENINLIFGVEWKLFSFFWFPAYLYLMHIIHITVLCAVVSSVDSYLIPKSIWDTMLNPGWWAAKEDEMHALE